MRKLLFFILIWTSFSARAQFYNMGLNYDDKQYGQAPKKALVSPGNSKDLPREASIKKYCPKPGNQLQMNTGAAWAVSWGALTAIEAQSKNWAGQFEITRNAYSPVYTYTLTKPENDKQCLSGTTLYDVLKSLKIQGTVKYEDFQEFCPPHSAVLKVRSQNDRITDFVRLFDIDEPATNKINSVKKVLSENKPVVIGMVCPPSFQTAKEFWQPREKLNGDFPAQALCVVGYDNDRFGGAFEVMNSWGTDWGNNGFMWIKYDDFAHFTKYAYQLIKVEKQNQQISGVMRLVLDDHTPILLENVKNGVFRCLEHFKSGTNFQLFMQNDQPVFVYTFGTDLGNTYYPIFPYNDNVSAAMPDNSTQIVLPGENNYIRLTGDPGKDYLCIILSKTPLDIPDEMDKLKHFGNSLIGNIQNQFHDYLDNSIITVTSPGNKIQFSTSDPNQKAVMLIVEIDHVL